MKKKKEKNGMSVFGMGEVVRQNLPERLTNLETDRQRDRRMDRQTDRQAERQTDKGNLFHIDHIFFILPGFLFHPVSFFSSAVMKNEIKWMLYLIKYLLDVLPS